MGFGVLIYLGDVLLYAADPEKLIELLQKVMKLLSVAGLKCKANKCNIFAEMIYYFGNVVSRNGLRPESAKIDKI